MLNRMVERRGKVLWQVTTSLDGFIAGPDDSMAWTKGVEDGPNPMVDDVMANLGAVLVGRRTWGPGGTEEGSGLYGDAWSGPIFVLTHHVPAPGEPGHGDPWATFLDLPLADAVATALDAAGGKDVNLIGADVATQCVDAGLVDEVILHVAPVLLGDGTRLFSRPGPHVRLDWVEQTAAGGCANLRLRPRAA
jgi:dihydrofolate reductase